MYQVDSVEVLSLSLSPSIQCFPRVLDNINANHFLYTVFTSAVVCTAVYSWASFIAVIHWSSQHLYGTHLRGDQVRGREGVKGHIQGQLIA